MRACEKTLATALDIFTTAEGITMGVGVFQRLQDAFGLGGHKYRAGWLAHASISGGAGMRRSARKAKLAGSESEQIFGVITGGLAAFTPRASAQLVAQ